MKRIAAVGIALLFIAMVVGFIGCAVAPRGPSSPTASHGQVAQRGEQQQPARRIDAEKMPAVTTPLSTVSSSFFGIGGSGSGGPAGRLLDAGAPAPTEELWVIAKPQDAGADVKDDRTPGSGTLMAKLPDKVEQVPVPLKHTDVRASIAGYIATVDVKQQYQNPYSEKIEAVYVFPLPTNAAVNEFLMTVGDRKIRGIIREREEAKQIYEQAKAQGYVASLLTQERPNVFTQSVANIEPGKAIDIDIKYFHTLEYVDGWYEWVFPMVVGPRFNPPGTTDGIGAKSQGSAPGVTGQETEVSYLRPDQRSGHDIALAVQIDAGVRIEKIDSRNHKVITEAGSDTEAIVALDPADTIPNKDFVLRYKAAGQTVKSAVMVQRDAKNSDAGYFTLMLVPPATLANLPRQPLEMVFTLDVSGSMSGEPIEQSRAAIKYALTHMRPDDTFQIIRFADGAELMSPQPLPATQENIRSALRYIEQMEAGGGTMMLDGIRKSLATRRDESRSRFVAFLTDGYIGNEAEILREVHNSLDPQTRIFSFGVGSSTNRYLLDHMAKVGAGAVAYLGLHDKADDVMSAYFERISHPALTDLAVDFGAMKTSDVFPQKLPDLFVGRPVILTGRFTGHGATTLHVKGRVGGEARDFEIPVDLDDASSQHGGIASVWARAKIADLADRSTWEPGNDLPGNIKQVALEHGLMSAFTAFVAVDSSTQTAGDHGTTVAVPVPVPEGVKYETTVNEK
jgi:Ca-activated chloride channel family protein